ncbi:MAG: Hsp20/alpha crystallin family protein [Nitrospiraceae bacterium]|nr:Hsp20/alpha crystallin family protein [Nitrospiraceae bacterium]
MAGKEEKKEDLDIDLGVVKLSAGGLFKGLEKLVDLAAKLQEAGGKISKEEEMDLSRFRKGMKAVYGVSIRTAAGGEPVVETFGNFKKTGEGPLPEDEREPLVDVFDEKEEVVVLAEIPGVSEEGIKVGIEGNRVDIRAEGKNRKYGRQVELPSGAKPETMTTSYKNGILEIRIKK